MARPTNKSQLLELSETNFHKLLSFIDQRPITQQQMEFPPGTLNRDIRDVLAHLHHWHLLFFEWYTIGMKGEKPAIPAKGYTWKTTPDLNAFIQRHHHERPLAEVRQLLADSHKKVTHLIEAHSNDELFEKKRYRWTGSSSLGAYLVSATSSHYDWALKLIKRCCRE